MTDSSNIYWNLVGGRISNMSGKTFEVKSPFYPDYVTHVADSNLFDAQVAVSKAKSSFDACQQLDFEERKDILQRAGKHLKFSNEDKEYVVKMTGMPIKRVEDYLSDIPTLVKTLPGLIESRIGVYGGRIGMNPLDGSNMFKFLEPIEGITYVITPGNDPRIVPFVASWLVSLGIPAIFKVSKNDIRIPELVIDEMIKQGYPPGALNILSWNTSDPEKNRVNFDIVDRSKVVWVFGDDNTVDNKLRFESLKDTQGARVVDHFSDKIVLRHASGRSAGIIDSDVDSKKVADMVMASSMHWPLGCNSMKALFTVNEMHDEIADRLCDRLSRMKVGDPMSPKTDVGYINPSDLSLVNNRIDALSKMGLLTLMHGQEVYSPFQRSPILANTHDINSEFIASEYPAYLLTMKNVGSYDSAIDELNRTSRDKKRLSVSVYSNEHDKVLKSKINAHHVKSWGPTTELDVLFHEGQDYLHKLTEPQIHRVVKST